MPSIRFLFRTEALLPSPKPSLLSYIRLVSSAKFSVDTNHKADSFTVSYLINSCGLSPESAISASRSVKLEAPHKPDSVLNFLRNHGFSETQISELVKRLPKVLLASPEKTLLPKLKFFESNGVSEAYLRQALSSSPFVLFRSLNNHIIPCYNHFKNLLGSDKEVVNAMVRAWGLVAYGVSDHFLRNVELLKQNGVPNSSIVLMLKHYPEVLTFKNNDFVEIIEQVKEMGFDSIKSTFVLAMHAIAGENKTIWERSYQIYTDRWGWSKEETMMAFKKHPNFMLLSEEKITQKMKYFVYEMGWPSNFIVKYPVVLILSLEKRIKPRCSVVLVLSKRGLINKDDISLSSLFCPGEDSFLKKYVHKYLEQVPVLLSVYEGRTIVSDL